MQRPGFPSAARPLPGVVAALLVGAVFLVVVAGGTRSGPESERAAPITPLVSGACLGASVNSPATGTLELKGSSAPLPSLSGVSVEVDYFYTEMTVGGSSSNESCQPTSATGTTNGTGAFSVPLPIPGKSCPSSVCIEYSGPYGPLGFRTAGAPAGFVEQDPANGTSPGTIQWDANLYSAQLNVSGPEVVSVDAPVKVSVQASNALGEPAPGPLAYHWYVAGLGWGSTNVTEPNVTVEGTESGWDGSVYVTIDADYAGTTESASSTVLSLLPVSTEVQSAAASPNPADPGISVTFDVTASGAFGYAYSVTVDPGLGVGPVSGPCTSVRLPNGTANLTCEAHGLYPVAGNATSTVSVSNGFSTGQLTGPTISVHPVELVTLHAPSLLTYANRTVNVTVSVTPGTGNGPYGPACLSVNGTPGLTCQLRNGTSWVFPVSFAAPGDYDLQAFVADRLGENASATGVVVVVPWLAARPAGASTLTFVADRTGVVSVIVSGGALPLETWWNFSGAASPLCVGEVPDGPISCVYAPAVPGSSNLTLTVRDALGTEAQVAFRIIVTAATPVNPRTSAAVSDWIDAGLVAGLTAAILAVILLGRRRHRPSTSGPTEPRVEESELERLARGREHLLDRADLRVGRPSEELVAGWTGPPVAPEEWAEWIAALVADGSLVPARDARGRLRYRSAAPRPTTTTIQFDPSVWEAHQAVRDAEPDPGAEAPDRQGGG